MSYSDDDIDNMDFLPDDLPPTQPTQPTQHKHTAYVETVEDDPDDMDIDTHAQIRALDSHPHQIPSHVAANLRAEMKRWICLYPIYFDRAVSSRRGRRVPSALAFDRPTVWHIAKALERLRFPGIVEAEKTHPADPLNPGRVRTLIWDKDLRAYVSLTVANRRQLFAKIAQVLPDVQDDVDLLLAQRERQQQEQVQAMQEQFAKMGMGGLPGMPGAGAGAGGMPGMDALAGLLGGGPGETPAAPETPVPAAAAKGASGKGKGKGKQKSGGGAGGKKGKR